MFGLGHLNSFATSKASKTPLDGITAKHDQSRLVLSRGIVFDALMEHRRSDGAPPTLTAVIAKRVKALRTAARMSGAALAAAMQQKGVPWNRTTVAKLETGRRESVTVPELLALALVLGVPLTALLVDERAERTYLAEGREYAPVDVLLWLTADRPLPGTPQYDRTLVPLNIVIETGPWVDAARPARYARKLLDAHDAGLGARQRLTMAMEKDYRPEVERSEQFYASRLADLATALTSMRTAGMTPPPIDARLQHDAQQRGIQLPTEPPTERND
jgi:transcriptional regulator with XRE-family HTH domain